MPKFTYTGETTSGAPVQKTVEAPDRFAVYEIARKDGHTVSKVSEFSNFSVSSIFNSKKIEQLTSRVSDDDLIMMTRNLSAMIHAGLSLTRALAVIERQSNNAKLKEVMSQVRERITKGDSFHESLKQHPKVFSDLYVAMVRAGEESGGLVEALTTLGLQMERAGNLKKKIKGAMIYPAIVLSVMLLIGVLMMIYVVPTLSATFKSLDTELPTATKLIIGTSDALTNHTLLILGIFIAFVTGMVAFLRTPVGRRGFEWFILHLPVIGTLVRETNGARTARTLSSLLRSGVDIVGALEITADVVQNSYFSDIVRKSIGHVQQGNQLSEILIAENKLYPAMLGEMVQVGEETGQISEMLLEVANFYESEVERKTKDLSTIIEPVLMVFIGGGVGFFALAMIAPIYSLADSIG